MSNKFISINRKDSFVLPADLDGWLAEDSLARFIVEVVDQLDTRALEDSYKGGGSPPYPPKMMLALVFYCYATGIFSSRAIEKASYELIPVIYITGNTHPDHNSINTFRKRFLQELNELFLQILLIAHQLEIFKLGDISMDGTKIKANASKHKAMSWKYANQLEKQLTDEVEKLLRMAESANPQSSKEIDIPSELKRRQDRLERIAQAKAEIEARAQARYEVEKAEYDEKMSQRKAKENQTGKKPGGRPPKEPQPDPRDKDQVNFTDEESRIMPTSGGGFEQAYNAQASVDLDSLIIVGKHVTQNPNDKQEIEPALEELGLLPEEMGTVNNAAADSGFFSENNINKMLRHGLTPYIPSGRQSHYPPLEERLAPLPEIPKNADPVTTMRHRMKTEEGKAFYAKRKSTVEPVFGIIKQVIGFRQFLLRGLQAVQGEWNLVCIAFNLKRMHALAG